MSFTQIRVGTIKQQPKRPGPAFFLTLPVTFLCVASGGITFAGSAAINGTGTATGAGGITFDGVAPVNTVSVVGTSGGIAFGGSAAASFDSQFFVTGSGGIAFAGAATINETFVRTGAGGIAFAGTGAGVVVQHVTGSAGIPSAEAFGTTGRLKLAIGGNTGIPSAEAFGGSGAVLGGEQFALYIRGKLRNKYYQVDPGFSATFELRGRGSAQFVTKDVAGRYQPRVGDEVVFFEHTARRFGGYVETVETSFTQGNGALVCAVTCVDYAEIMERRTVTATYDSGTLQLSAIVADIVANCLDGEGIGYVKNEDTTLTDQGKLIFNGDTVRVAMDKCADIFGYDWRIDASRNLFFERNHTVIAPYVLRDDDGRWATMVVKRSRRDFRNVQTVRTTIPTAGLGTKTTVGNGTWTYQVDAAILDKPTIKVNTVEKIVVKGPAPLSLTPWDFWWDRNSTAVHQNPHQAAYVATDTIVITYRNAALDLHTVTDPPSITKLAAMDGGKNSGRYEVVTRANNVISAPVAQQVGTALLSRYAINPVEIDIEMTNKTTGWEIGQLLPISTSLIHGSYILKTVAFQEVGATFLRYKLTAYGIDPPPIVGIVKTSETTVDVTTVDPIDPGIGTVVTGVGDLPGTVIGNGTPCVIEYPAGTSLPPIGTSLTIFDPVTYDSLPAGIVSHKSPPNFGILYPPTQLFVPPVGTPLLCTAPMGYSTLTALVSGNGVNSIRLTFAVGAVTPPIGTTVTFEGLAPWDVLGAGVVTGALDPTGPQMTLTFPLGTGLPPAGTAIRVEGLTPWDMLPFGVVISSGDAVTTVELPTGNSLPDLPPAGTILRIYDPITYDSLPNGVVEDNGPPLINVFYTTAIPVLPITTFLLITAPAAFAGVGVTVVSATSKLLTVSCPTNVDIPTPGTMVTLESTFPFDSLPAGVVQTGPKSDLSVAFPDLTGLPPQGCYVRLEGASPWDHLPMGTVKSSVNSAFGDVSIVARLVVSYSPVVIPDVPGTGILDGTIGGGGLSTGLGPTYDSPSGVGEDAPIPISYVVDGARIPEFTTDRDHGKSDGQSVTIVGVTGGDHNGVFNNQNTRINVTATNKFRALDNFVPSFLTDPFQDDKKGRVYDANDIPRPILTNGPTNTLLTYFQGLAADPINRDIDKATFVLAQAIPGFASRPLIAANNVTNPYIAQKDGVIDNVSASFATPSIGGPIVIDIIQYAGGVGSGVSIFGDTKLVIPAESTGVTTVSDFNSTAVTVAPGDVFKLNVDQVGADFPGCNGTVVMSIRG